VNQPVDLDTFIDVSNDFRSCEHALYKYHDAFLKLEGPRLASKDFRSCENARRVMGVRNAREDYLQCHKKLSESSSKIPLKGGAA